MAQAQSTHRRGRKRFVRAASLVERRITKVAETRGFAVSRLLTQWPEIAGTDIAALCRPVDVGYGRAGLGATLTVLTTGPQAPLLEMRKEALRERVNACYGYAAVKRIRITQTAPQGFAETAAPLRRADTPPRDPKIHDTARRAAMAVADDGLRAALEQLGRNVLGAERQKETP